jgi:hypothetical protein
VERREEFGTIGGEGAKKPRWYGFFFGTIGSFFLFIKINKIYYIIYISGQYSVQYCFVPFGWSVWVN